MAEPTARVRWGIIGTGNIAGNFADDLRLSPLGELVAVASRSADRATAFQARTGAQRSYASHADLLDADDIDAIYIAVPTLRTTRSARPRTSPARRCCWRSFHHQSRRRDRSRPPCP